MTLADDCVNYFAGIQIEALQFIWTLNRTLHFYCCFSHLGLHFTSSLLVPPTYLTWLTQAGELNHYRTLLSSPSLNITLSLNILTWFNNQFKLACYSRDAFQTFLVSHPPHSHHLLRLPCEVTPVRMVTTFQAAQPERTGVHHISRCRKLSQQNTFRNVAYGWLTTRLQAWDGPGTPGLACYTQPSRKSSQPRALPNACQFQRDTFGGLDF